MRIAVDFDGTIVDHAYPAIGKEKLFAFQTLKELQKRGCFLILWTYRTGKELDEALEFCRKNGLEFYAVNKNYPEEIMDETVSRKINADIYIDDRNLGGFPGWSEVWQIINPDNFDFNHEQVSEADEKTLFSKLMSIFKFK
jgi:hydroxymethylpyrimidine pyrophosphatase-like HAD family hydrolase